MIQRSNFDVASVSKNSILVILKWAQVLKEIGLYSLSGKGGDFLKVEAKFLAKAISDLCSLSINSKKFPDLSKVAKFKPIKMSLMQPGNYRPLSLLYPNIQGYGKSHSQSNKYLSELKKFVIHLTIWFSKRGFCRFLSFLFEW